MKQSIQVRACPRCKTGAVIGNKDERQCVNCGWVGYSTPPAEYSRNGPTHDYAPRNVVPVHPKELGLKWDDPKYRRMYARWKFWYDEEWRQRRRQTHREYVRKQRQTKRAIQYERVVEDA